MSWICSLQVSKRWYRVFILKTRLKKKCTDWTDLCPNRSLWHSFNHICSSWPEDEGCWWCVMLPPHPPPTPPHPVSRRHLLSQHFTYMWGSVSLWAGATAEVWAKSWQRSHRETVVEHINEPFHNLRTRWQTRSTKSSGSGSGPPPPPALLSLELPQRLLCISSSIKTVMWAHLSRKCTRKSPRGAGLDRQSTPRGNDHPTFTLVANRFVPHRRGLKRGQESGFNLMGSHEVGHCEAYVAL